MLVSFLGYTSLIPRLHRSSFLSPPHGLGLRLYYTAYLVNVILIPAKPDYKKCIDILTVRPLYLSVHKKILFIIFA